MPRTHCPLHPGKQIRKRLAQWKQGANMTYLATRMGISRSALSRVVNGRTAVKPGLALRLARVFQVSAESWLRKQAAYDLWHARRARRRNRKTVPFDATVRITGRIRVPLAVPCYVRR
jgi:antitoxin HigA-1